MRRSQRDLKVMDTAAFALARENRLPIIVGSAHGAGAITSILTGQSQGDPRHPLNRSTGGA